MSKENGDTEHFWAVVHTAKAIAHASSNANQPYADAQIYFKKVLFDSPWQLNAAFRFKPTWRTLIDRAFAYRQLKRHRKALAEEKDSPEQRERLEKLTRALGMVEFGVSINEQWFRRFDSLIANGEITKRQLQRLLSCIEVTTDENGDLVVHKFHPISRSVIGTFLIFWISLGLIFLLAASEQFGHHGYTSSGGWFFFCYFIWSLCPTWVVWWLGPHSWMSSKKLRVLLGGFSRSEIDPSAASGLTHPGGLRAWRTAMANIWRIE